MAHQAIEEEIERCFAEESFDQHTIHGKIQNGIALLKDSSKLFTAAQQFTLNL